MPTLREMLQSNAGERRAFGRTTINRGVLLYFAGREGVQACSVRDVTNRGAGIWLNGIKIVSSEFDISFDNFHTTRRCRLIWRNHDFVGVAFQS
jgi:hypothetical protein